MVFKVQLIEHCSDNAEAIGWNPVESLKVESKSLHKLKFYPSGLLLMIKMSQIAREKLDTLL